MDLDQDRKAIQGGHIVQRIGDFFVSVGLMSAQQVQTVLEIQRLGDKRSFGEIAVVLGFVEDNSLKRFADSLHKNDQTVI